MAYAIFLNCFVKNLVAVGNPLTPWQSTTFPDVNDYRICAVHM